MYKAFMPLLTLNAIVLCHYNVYCAFGASYSYSVPNAISASGVSDVSDVSGASIRNIIVHPDMYSA